MASIEKQTKLQTRIGNSYTNFKKTGQNKMTVGAATTRMEQLQRLWEQFDSNHEALLDDEEVEASDAYFENNVYDRVEESYLDNMAQFKDYLSELQVQQAGVSRDAYQANQPPVGSDAWNYKQFKLAPIEIPTFSGDVQEWVKFRDTFQELIVKNPNMPNICKMSKLLSALQGEAAELLKDASSDGSTFAAAWASVKGFYDNNRLLITNLLSKLITLAPMAEDTAAEVSRVHIRTKNILQALKSLGSPVDHWDHFVVFLTISRLTPAVQAKWEDVVGKLDNPQEPPSWETMRKFLESERLSLAQLASAQEAVAAMTASTIDNRSTSVNFAKSEGSKKSSFCPVCNGAHPIFKCESFLAKPPKERSGIVMKKQLCFNCLYKHKVQDCKSQKRCRECSRKHHTLLHYDDNSPSNHIVAENFAQKQESSPSPTNVSIATVPPSDTVLAEFDATQSNAVLLATAWIRAESALGYSQPCRAMIDQGAQSSFICESLCQLLKLQRQSVRVAVSGIGNSKQILCKSIVEFMVKPHFKSSFSCKVVAYVIPKITSYEPFAGSSIEWSHLQGLKLADPGFSKPGKIDVLLGASVHALIIEEGIRKGTTHPSPIAMNSSLGWIVSGASDSRSHLKLRYTLHTSTDNLDTLIRRFWEIEEVPKQKFMTTEEKECEDFYKKTTRRNEKGQYIVRLPRKSNFPLHWGNSRSIAARTQMSLEKRLAKNSDLKKAYVDSMREYLKLGHMIRVSSESLDSKPSYFLPHHEVIKESSTTTKMRTVFNASKCTDVGLSLNECLMVGPNLLPEVIDIFTHWRKYRVVFAADAEKMFRQIWVHEDDQHLQATLWREDDQEEMTSNVLTTVTFGFTSSPFLANRTVRQLAQDEATHFPLAVDVLENEIYMDDVLSGGDNVKEAKSKQEQVIGMMKRGGFSLRKWMSNVSELIEWLPEGMRASAASLNVGSGFSVLGIAWDPSADCFYFNIALEKLDKSDTRRTVFSKIAKLFDPLGWITPVIVALKIFMQSLWLLTKEWDTVLPAEYLDRWHKLYSSLAPIADIRIPRWIGTGSRTIIRYEFHGFADASKFAYAAVVYLRVIYRGGNSQVFLLGAKTRVAPIKTLSIPRLELCGVVLLAKLVKHFVDTLKLAGAVVHLWTDSKDVLFWLHEIPAKWAVFIGNRCAEILSLLPDAFRHHINSADNPADLASRGASAEEINNNLLWMHGPKRLLDSSEAWPQQHDIQALPSRYRVAGVDHQPIVVLATNDQQGAPVWDLIHQFSDLAKLLRVTTYVLKFIRKLVGKCSLVNRVSILLQVFPTLETSEPSQEELRLSAALWSKLTQQSHMENTVRILQRGEELSKSHYLKTLNPFVRHGVIRVGGRLRNSLLSFDEKHPIILPTDSRLADMVIADAHKRTLHGGTQLCLAHVRRQFWILKAKLKIKAYVRNCVTCLRFQSSSAYQMMGNLPAHRVQPSRPFANSGVDYAGPYLLRTSKHRGYKSYKGYFAVFICLSTKAVHLEAVSSYDTESFLAAFRRFVARRGPCLSLKSDQGTNFIGADAELRKMYKKSSDHTRLVQSALSRYGTTWSFNPPAAPHFGGIWEAAVKSVKRHLKRVVGDTIMTFEEFSTLLCQIEACLNSRPLLPLSEDPSELFVLTPAHFLIGESSMLIAEPDISDEKLGPLQRWRRTTQFVQRFWTHWSHDYLHQLQKRYRWCDQQPDFRVGDLVLIRSETTAPTRWPLGRIIKTFPGNDDLVRVVDVRTATTTLRRPISKLVKLLDDPKKED